MVIFVDYSSKDDNLKSYSIAYKSDNKSGFLDVTSNDSMIYALYSGKSIKDTGQGRKFSDRIMVLDWSGNTQFELRLPTETNIIAVDSKVSVL